MSEFEMTEPIEIGDNVTHYDVYYVRPDGLGIGTGDRFSSVMYNGVKEYGTVIAIQTLEPWKITASMDVDDGTTRLKEFMPSDISEVFPKPRGTR